MIKILNDRRVFPNNSKISNQYENETRTIQFDLSDVQFTGNTYLICKYQNNTDYYAPLLLDSNFSIPVETFLSAQAGLYSCVLAISTATIDENYNFSTDNPLFVSNVFTLNVDANFLTGTSTAWNLTPSAQNYFDQLIALVNKVQSDLDSGAFDGPQGPQGETGATPNLQIGTVTTLQPDEQATASITGSAENPLLNLGIPKGQTGQGSDNKLIGTVSKSQNPSINDSYDSEITNLNFYGQSTQIQMTGAQLFDISKFQNGTTCVNNGDGSITISKYAVNTNNKISDVLPTIEIGDVLYFSATNGTLVYVGGVVTNINQQKSIEITEQVLSNGSFGFYGSNSGEITISDIMVSKQYQSPYEPYTGGKPSPSPEYPQQITAISEVIGSVRNSYQLFDASKLPTTSQGGATVTNNGDGSFTITGSGKLSTNFYVSYNDTNIIKLLKEGNLTLDCGQKSYPYFSVFFFNESGRAIIGLNNAANSKVSTNITSEIISQTASIRFIIEGYTTASAKDITNTIIKPMVYQDGDGTWQPFDENPQEISFTPPQPLYSTLDGSIADVVDVENGEYVYNLGILDFTSADIVEVTSNGVTISGYSKFRFVINSKLLTNKAINPVVICNLLKYKFPAWSTDQVNIISADQATKNTFYAAVEGSINTPEDFKSLFDSGARIVYVLQTPTTQPIPAETLQQLQALKTYTGVTNFICNAAVSFKYEQSIQIVIQNILNQINQTNANLLLTGGN